MVSYKWRGTLPSLSSCGELAKLIHAPTFHDRCTLTHRREPPTRRHALTLCGLCTPPRGKTVRPQGGTGAHATTFHPGGQLANGNASKQARPPKADRPARRRGAPERPEASRSRAGKTIGPAARPLIIRRRAAPRVASPPRHGNPRVPGSDRTFRASPRAAYARSLSAAELWLRGPARARPPAQLLPGSFSPSPQSPPRAHRLLMSLMHVRPRPTAHVTAAETVVIKFFFFFFSPLGTR